MWANTTMYLDPHWIGCTESVLQCLCCKKTGRLEKTETSFTFTSRYLHFQIQPQFYCLALNIQHHHKPLTNPAIALSSAPSVLWWSRMVWIKLFKVINKNEFGQRDSSRMKQLLEHTSGIKLQLTQLGCGCYIISRPPLFSEESWILVIVPTE